jgi:hypothetical protein
VQPHFTGNFGTDPTRLRTGVSRDDCASRSPKWNPGTHTRTRKTGPDEPGSVCGQFHFEADFESLFLRLISPRRAIRFCFGPDAPETGQVAFLGVLKGPTADRRISWERWTIPTLGVPLDGPWDGFRSPVCGMPLLVMSSQEVWTVPGGFGGHSGTVLGSRDLCQLLIKTGESQPGIYGINCKTRLPGRKCWDTLRITGCRGRTVGPRDC